MTLLEAALLALRGVRSNKLRSGLTTLGIIIGVAAVIFLVALGNGVTAGFTANFASLATQITISPNQAASLSGREPRDLTDADADALADLPELADVVPTVSGQAVLQAGSGVRYQSTVTGTTTDYLRVLDRDLVVGRNFEADEVRRNAKVVLLAPGPVQDLFGGDAGAALGQQVRVDRATFRVIGVIAATGQDEIAVVPLGAARSFLLGGRDALAGITAAARTSEAVPAASEQIIRVLDRRHGIVDPTDRDYSVQSQQNLLETLDTTLSLLSLFTVAVAGISLVVGSIGVANIMLVTVTERTREIGIRKAIGAKRRAILQQFLLESTILSGLGGLAGILIGVGLSVLSGLLIPAVFPDFPVPIISGTSVVVSFAISLLIGLVAGGYPANRAAGLRPIEALRYQ